MFALVTGVQTCALPIYMRLGRAQAVMPGSAAALLHLDLEGREIELVVEDGDVGGREPVEAHRFADRLAAFVHEGRGLQEKEFLGAQPCLDRPADRTGVVSGKRVE